MSAVFMDVRSKFINISLVTSFCYSIISINSTFSETSAKDIFFTGTTIVRNYSCPQKLDKLMKQMLLDLPSYTNRVIQRTRSIVKDKKIISQRYVLIAGQAEFEPLTLNNLEYQAETKDSSQQVFFTTLEREYRDDRIIETQNYHWLFLALTKEGWQIVTMYSRFGIGSDTITMPPQDTTNGAIAQAIDLWLEDCRVGAIEE
jgi:hypothetical protein